MSAANGTTDGGSGTGPKKAAADRALGRIIRVRAAGQS